MNFYDFQIRETRMRQGPCMYSTTSTSGRNSSVVVIVQSTLYSQNNYCTRVSRNSENKAQLTATINTPLSIVHCRSSIRESSLQ